MDELPGCYKLCAEPEMLREFCQAVTTDCLDNKTSSYKVFSMTKTNVVVLSAN